MKILENYSIATSLVALLLVPSVHIYAADTGPAMSFGLFEHIDGTDPFGAIDLALSPAKWDISTGLSPSPSPSVQELRDALSEFTDFPAALANIEAIERKNNITGGSLFASYSYDESGHYNLLCGVSGSSAGNWDEVQTHTLAPGSNTGGAPFYRFKMATRAERVREIANCLAGISGMPPLKPTKPEIKHLLIDKNSYLLGRNWFKKHGYIGNNAQYDAALNCLVAQAARNLRDAVSDTAVMVTQFSTVIHTYHTKYTNLLEGPQKVETGVRVNGPSSSLVVLNHKAALALFSQDDPQNLMGPWSGRVEYMFDDAFDKTLEPTPGDLAGCTHAAGLVNASLGRGIVEQNPKCRQ